MVAVARSHKVPTSADFHAAISNRSDRWFSACLKITRNADMAADAVQDALLNAWNKRHQFQQSAKLETWIHRIAVNAALNQLRKHRPGVFEPLESDIESTLADPQRHWEEHELENDLAKALGSLTELERVCFVLKHLEQWSGPEIAESLGMSSNQVKQGVFRAVKKLRIGMSGMREEHNEQRY